MWSCRSRSDHFSEFWLIWVCPYAYQRDVTDRVIRSVVLPIHGASIDFHYQQH